MGVKYEMGKPPEKATDEIEIWENDCRGLLQSKIMPIYDEEFEEDKSTDESTLEEIKGILRTDRNGKTPGEDTVNMEIIK